MGVPARVVRHTAWSRRLLSRRAVIAAATVGIGVSALHGCSVFSPEDGPRGVVTTSLEVRAVPNANGDSPVAVDVVVPYAKEMMDQLVGITAREWFRRREQFKRDFPTEFDLLELEIVPGTVRKEDLQLRDSAKAEGAIVFASYFSEGVHRVRIDRLENIVIDLLEHQFVVRQIEPE